jgi:hypothetical protein
MGCDPKFQPGFKNNKMSYNPKGNNPVEFWFTNGPYLFKNFRFFKFSPIPTQRVATRGGLQPKIFDMVKIWRVWVNR